MNIENTAHAVLDIADVGKRFGRNVALSDVTMTVARGEIRGVIGRNGAGKSTLMGIASGFLTPDSGVVRVNGVDASGMNREQYRAVVGMVHQHSTLVSTLSIAENFILGGRPAERLGLVNWREVNASAQKLLDEWGTGLRATQLVSELTLAQRQLAEIIRELARGVDLVILDEPTSRLEKADVAALFENVRAISARGTAVVYISHHLAEIHELCDRVTVLRDGRLVATHDVEGTSESQLVHEMIGGENKGRLSRLSAVPVSDDAGTVLELRRLEAPGLRPLDLEVRAGECVGIAGLIGSGKEELGTILGGLGTAKAGSIRVGGTVARKGVLRLMDAGIGFLPADRHTDGLVLQMSINENITMTVWRRIQNAIGLLRGKLLRSQAAELARDTGVATISDLNHPVGALSGGNQQKVAIGRAIASNPKVLVLVNPTTGVDIASKRTIYELIQRKQREGIAILLISDEPDEFSFCNRIVALFRGEPVRIFGEDADEAELVSAIEGVDTHHVSSN